MSPEDQQYSTANPSLTIVEYARKIGFNIGKTSLKTPAEVG